MHRGRPQHSPAHSAHPHVDLGQAALSVVLVHVHGRVLHQEPSLQVVGNDMRLEIVQLNAIIVAA